jgi:hypothetical protein
MSWIFPAGRVVKSSIVFVVMLTPPKSTALKKIFISFAIEDKFARDNLVYQAKQSHTPFEFTDMSVKTPWDSQWKTNCRQRIRGCQGMIAFISDNTYSADGARWEIKCGYEEGIRVYAVYIHDHGARRIPPELGGRRIYHWTWANITSFLDSLK